MCLLNLLRLVSIRSGRLNTFHMMKTDGGSVVSRPTTPTIASTDTCILAEIFDSNDATNVLGWDT